MIVPSDDKRKEHHLYRLAQGIEPQYDFSDPAANLQEIQGTKKQVELHNECSISKLQMVGYF